jgi:hypothetical protein
MKKKLNIPKDFWKDFKDRKDFDEFFGELFQEGINQMLKGEMTRRCTPMPLRVFSRKDWMLLLHRSLIFKDPAFNKMN